ncbi:hypothetical protein ACFXTN_012203 [Malus domestica]
MQHAPDEVSQSKTRVGERDSFQRRLGKELLSLPLTMCSGSVHCRLGPRGNIFSCLDVQISVHSRLGSRVSVHSRLGPHSDDHSRRSRRSVHTRLGPQEDPPTRQQSRQPHDA